MTPEAVERRRLSGLSKLDDYNCPFKLAYSKLRFAKNQNSRKWKPRIFHIGTFAKKRLADPPPSVISRFVFSLQLTLCYSRWFFLLFPYPRNQLCLSVSLSLHFNYS
jgi:hypothetical protein